LPGWSPEVRLAKPAPPLHPTATTPAGGTGERVVGAGTRHGVLPGAGR
jgi:hypothetical protein